MNRILSGSLCLLTALVLFVTSCSPKAPALSNQASEYYYVLMDDCEVRDSPMIAEPSRRLRQAMAGDTLMAIEEIKNSSGWHSFVRDSFLVYMYSPMVRFATTKTIPREMAANRVYKNSALATEWWVIESKKATQPSNTRYSPSASRAESTNTRYSTPATGATIHTGPRGGRYYYNSKGNKTYIKKK